MLFLKRRAAVALERLSAARARLAEAEVMHDLTGERQYGREASALRTEIALLETDLYEMGELA